MRATLWGCLTVALGVAACGATTVVEVEITDHADPLTANPGDRLFVLGVARSFERFPLTELVVSAAVAGGAQARVECSRADGLGDGELGEGESLLCVEPSVNRYGPPQVGAPVPVFLMRNWGVGALRQLAQGTWSPEN